MIQTSNSGDHPLCVSDLDLQPQSYSAARSPTTPDSSPVHAVRSSASPAEDSIRHHAKTSLTDIMLDNVTYDTILASTTKGLHLDLNAQYLNIPSSPLPSSDARAPPNTPASPNMARYGSLNTASTMIMESKGDDGGSQI